MVAVGLRELKAKLSDYVRKARGGETVLVTDRGLVVAELRAPTLQPADPESEAMNELVRSGAILRGVPNNAELYERTDLALPDGTSHSILGWMRGDGELPVVDAPKRSRERRR
jgi:antitoxin (DNA-binding transcriptional repressor) of toxin-antitoxin stability system